MCSVGWAFSPLCLLCGHITATNRLMSSRSLKTTIPFRHSIEILLSMPGDFSEIAKSAYLGDLR
jgi:hypothetical protein